MLRFALRRLAAALVLLWIVLTSTFFLLHIAPGDPIQILAGPRTSEQTLDRLREYYGLDRPLGAQYLIWLGAVLRGDWGVSITQQRSAVSILANTFPNTLVLVAGVLLVEYVLGVVLGVVSAARAGSFWDHKIRSLSLLLYSVPVFWLGLLLIHVLAVRWRLFPVDQMISDGAHGWPWGWRLADLLHHLALPAAALGLHRCGAVVRFVRNGLLEILSQDYIQTARSIGLGNGRVIWVHGLKNALGPLVQRFGYTLPGLLSGAIVTEVVFAWPGLGRATYDAVIQRDYPLVLAATGLSGVLVVASNFLADLLHAAIDPRIRDHGL